MALDYRLAEPRLDDAFPRTATTSRQPAIAPLFSRNRRAKRCSTIAIVVRSDGAVAIDIDGEKPGAGGPRVASSSDIKPVVIHFRTPGAAESVSSGAHRRLAAERTDASGQWYLNISAGQAAAAVKGEAKALSYSFEVVHPYLRGAPTVRTARPDWRRRSPKLALYALMTSAAALIGLVAGVLIKGF